MKDNQPIEVGDRFITRESRDAGRVVEVTEALGLTAWGASHIGRMGEAVAEDFRRRQTRFRIRTEAHPRNPEAVGNVSQVSEKTLRVKYKRVSR